MLTCMAKWGRSSVSGGSSAAMWMMRVTPWALTASISCGKLRDVAPVHGDAVEIGREVGPRRREVKADHLLAALQQLADDAVADKPGSAGNHYGHLRSPRSTEIQPRLPSLPKHEPDKARRGVAPMIIWRLTLRNRPMGGIQGPLDSPHPLRGRPLGRLRRDEDESPRVNRLAPDQWGNALTLTLSRRERGLAGDTLGCCVSAESGRQKASHAAAPSLPHQHDLALHRRAGSRAVPPT